jgi:hypothetical protein
LRNRRRKGRIVGKERSENEARYKNIEGQRDRDRDTDLQTGGGRETKTQGRKYVTNKEEMRGRAALRTEGNRSGERWRERDRSRHSSHAYLQASLSPPRGGKRQERERQSNHACLSPSNRGCQGRDVEEAGLPRPSEVSLSLPVSLCLPNLRSRETSWEHSEVSVSL